MDEDSTAAATNNESVNALKRKSGDIGWQYGTLADPLNTDKVKCNFCDKVSMGGVYRLKQHISGYGSSVKTCTKAPPEAVQACRKTFEEMAKKKKEKLDHDQGLQDDVHITSGHGAPDEDITCAGSSTPHKLGPMDKWARPIDPNLSQAAQLQQQRIDQALWQQRTLEVQQYIAKWVYTHAEYARTKSLLKDRDEEKMKNGCSLMTDAWTDMKRRSIMNIVTHCAEGTSFIKSKDTSDVSHTSEVIFNLVDNAIEEVGAEHVVQVVTDIASNNMGAKALLLEKRQNIFWSSCATHTINLMLQGIGNLPKFKKVIDQTKAFTIFIYGHHRTLECMRSFTKKREIIRSGVTRFASQYLTLQSMMEKKDSLRRMVVDAKWDGLKDVHTKKGKDATATILNVAYWKAVNLCLKVFEPLVKVLRLVDGDVKPSMGFVYGEIVKAKREIKEAFGNVEICYKEVMAIVDKKMRGRLDGPLQLIAYMLNPYYSYADSSIFDDTDITTAFIACVEQFYNGSGDDIQDQVVNHEYIKFSKKEGMFGKKIARAYENFNYNRG
ncbi:hypothetical protein LINPERHAP1_LOCUS144 [Linum perenne]